MRISDWSSDVCSSDLDSFAGIAPSCVPAFVAAQMGGAITAHIVSGLVFPAAPQNAALAEIGRASCRERVCQYVSISVVAVSFTQKRRYYDTVNRNIDHQRTTHGVHT